MVMLLAIGLTVLILLLATRVPVALALAAAGATGILLDQGAASVTSTFASLPYEAVASVTLVVIPMFILMGIFAEKARVPADVFSFANRLFRGLPGGLGLATIVACAVFGAVSGSSVAAAATIGRIAIREMLSHGYRAHFAAGIVAMGGTLSVLIPPSIILVLFGIISGESVGALLLAGIVPGAISALLLLVGVLYLAVFTPGKVFTSPSTTVGDDDGETGADAVSMRAHIGGFAKAIILFTVVIGGIYGGFFTVSEAAAIATLVALVILGADVFKYGWRYVFKGIGSSLAEASSTSSFIFAILAGAGIFTYFLVSIGVPAAFASWAVGLPVPGIVVILCLLLLMIPLGMFLDPMSILLIMVPISYPVVTEFGYDGIWFGIMVVKFIELGLVTPPVGLNVFVVASVPGVTLSEAFRGIGKLIPFEVLAIAVLFFFPALSTWLPSLLR